MHFFSGEVPCSSQMDLRDLVLNKKRLKGWAALRPWASLELRAPGPTAKPFFVRESSGNQFKTTLFQGGQTNQKVALDFLNLNAPLFR